MASLLKTRPIQATPVDTERTLEQRVARIEELLLALVERQTVREWYTVEEFARIVRRVPFTVREWARLGRLSAEKRKSDS